MKAFQLIQNGSPGLFEIREISDPVPQTGQALIRVKACGLNRLDLWAEDGALPVPIALPRTPGCEMAGEVAVLGPECGCWRVGDRVAVQSNLFCGQCEFCKRGEESLCLQGKLLGVDCDGGFAEYVLVPAQALVRLEPGISYVDAAGLTLAASTAMHMLTRRSTVRPGDWVLVIAAGSGVGSAAIQIAKSLGARVITTGSTRAKREFGLSLGADMAVDATAPDWAASIRQLTGKRGVDLVVEHVGGTVLEQAFHCLARGGTIVTCGATAGRDVSLKLWPLFVKQQRLVGSYGRDRIDMEATLAMAAAGKLKASICETFDLKDTGRAYTRLRAREVAGKLVVVP